MLLAAKRRVQSRSSLGEVHLCASEEPLASPGDISLAGQCEKQAKRLGGQALLGKIKRESCATESQRGASPGILGKQAIDARGVERTAVRE